MPDLKGLKAGDLIMVPNGWRGERHVEKTVSKVGRVWLYVGEEWAARKFRISDGSEEGYSENRAMTVQDYRDREARAEVIAALSKKGVETYRRWTDPLTLDQLRRVLAILEE